MAFSTLRFGVEYDPDEAVRHGFHKHPEEVMDGLSRVHSFKVLHVRQQNDGKYHFLVSTDAAHRLKSCPAFLEFIQTK